MEFALVGVAAFAPGVNSTEWTGAHSVLMRQRIVMIDAGPEDRIGLRHSSGEVSEGGAQGAGPDVDSGSLAVRALRSLSAHIAVQGARARRNHCVALPMKSENKNNY